MALMRAAEPTLQGIPSELRNEIYGLVADETTRKPIILGRKVAQAAKQFLFNGVIREQALSTIAQHPLEMTCRQIRAEFQNGFHDDYARSQTYEFVVDNFDFEQLKLFEELQHAKHGDRLRMVKSHDQMMRDRKLAWMSKVSFKLRFQMNRDVVASATALTKSLKLCSQGRERYSNVPDNNTFLDVDDFTVSFKYSIYLSGLTNEAETMTIAQAKEALEVLKRSKRDWQYTVPMLVKLLARFTGLLDAHTYLESQHEDHLKTLAAELQMQQVTHSLSE
jgi:hypothetical protein